MALSPLLAYQAYKNTPQKPISSGGYVYNADTGLYEQPKSYTPTGAVPSIPAKNAPSQMAAIIAAQNAERQANAQQKAYFQNLSNPEVSGYKQANVSNEPIIIPKQRTATSEAKATDDFNKLVSSFQNELSNIGSDISPPKKQVVSNVKQVSNNIIETSPVETVSSPVKYSEGTEKFRADTAKTIAYLQQAKDAGLTSIDLIDASGNKVGTTNPQDITRARYDILKKSIETGGPITSEGLVSSMEVTTSTEPQYFRTNDNPLKATLASVAEPLLYTGYTLMAPLANLAGRNLFTGKPGQTTEQDTTKFIEKNIGQTYIDQLMAGKFGGENLTPAEKVGSLIGSGLGLYVLGGGGGKNLIQNVLEKRAVKNIVSEILPDINKNIRVDEAISRTSSKIQSVSRELDATNAVLQTKFQPTLSEKILGSTDVTKSSLVKEAAPIIQKKQQLETQIEQLSKVKSNLENLRAISPNEIVAKTTVPVIEKIEKVGNGVHALYFKDQNSKYAGAILSLGQKGESTLIPILKTVPEGTKAVPSAELMSGVRGVIRTSLAKNQNLAMGQQIENVSLDVNKYLKGKNLPYEVTYPKNPEEIGGVSLGSFNERVNYLSNILTPKPTVYAVGKEIPTNKIRQIINERKSPDIFSKLIIGNKQNEFEGIRTKKQSDLLEEIKTGDIHFTKTNIEHIAENLGVLKQPLETREFASGTGIKEKPYEKGFNYLASRFGEKGNVIFKSFGSKPSKIDLTKIEPLKVSSGSEGRARSYGKTLQKAKDKTILEQMMKEQDSTKPLSKIEIESLLREVGSRYTNPRFKYSNKVAPVYGERTRRRSGYNTLYDTEYEFLRYPGSVKVSPYAKVRLNVIQNYGLNSKIGLGLVNDMISRTRTKQDLLTSTDLFQKSKSRLDLNNRLREFVSLKLNTGQATGLKTRTDLITTQIQVPSEIITTKTNTRTPEILRLGGGFNIDWKGTTGSEKRVRGRRRVSFFQYSVNPNVVGVIAEAGKPGKIVSADLGKLEGFGSSKGFKINIGRKKKKGSKSKLDKIMNLDFDI